MFKTFRQLSAHIRTNISQINWIDRDKGQLETPENYNSIITPGVLLNFAPVNWKGQSRGNQLGEGAVTVKLVFSLPTSTHEGAEWNDYEQFETLPDWLYDVMSAHATIGDRRTSSDYFTDNFYVFEQTFDLKTYQTKQVTTRPKPLPDIQGTLSHTLIITQ